MNGASAKRTRRLREQTTAWLLLLPTLAFLGLFTLYPMGKTVYQGFFDARLGLPAPVFAGFDNYARMLENEVFYKVMRNTFVFVGATVPLSIALALAMALFANRAFRSVGWVRTSFFYPTVIPAIAVASIWLFLYTPDYGLFSRVAGWFGWERANVLGQPDTVLWATIAMAVWREAGYLMVFFLAGLQQVPKDLYEAAAIDGADRWTVFRRITFPLLMPTTLFVSIVGTTGAFKTVDHIVVMTKGGPDNASNLLLYYIYETAFKFWDIGLASVLTVVMLLMLLLIACVQFFGLDRKIHYS
ncbi:sugar ABC transporter permease [Paenibacillus sp. TRM 82003]|nr:sugar ABC transporter permease [Paenibacillus sp. TRM 82003]MCI3923363.1 sugar ABC transporter permease [Paenibacillus sp. TRM 82003]